MIMAKSNSTSNIMEVLSRFLGPFALDRVVRTINSRGLNVSPKPRTSKRTVFAKRSTMRVL